jgi:GH25 family lysozyme M1 (1,4-beta-N-acetylmuramidase)
VTTPQPPRVRILLTGVLAALVCLPAWSATAAVAAVPTSRAVAAVHLVAAVPAKASKKTKITKNLPATVTVSTYGTRTSATLKVKASGTKLRYIWQHRAPGKTTWAKVKKGKSAKLKVTAKWSTGTGFRVVVKGKRGSATSAVSTLTVLSPTNTPATDAQTKFGLTGLSQGVDLSAYQYGVSFAKVAEWAGPGGFTMFRTASGARPVHTAYVSLCGGAKLNTGSVPVVEDCAYPGFADQAAAKGLKLGHYWFNGWITTKDPTSTQVFANGYTVSNSASDFVKWVLADGNYTSASTDPLVLDVENGRAWTTKSGGRKYTASLRAWTPLEAAAFVQAVKALLPHANLYVYMSANAASKKASDGSFLWAPLATTTRLWVASWGTNNGRVPDAQPKTGPWPTWSIWQYTSSLRIAGSRTGAIDADLAKPDAWTPLG